MGRKEKNIIKIIMKRNLELIVFYVRNPRDVYDSKTFRKVIVDPI